MTGLRRFRPHIRLSSMYVLAALVAIPTTVQNAPAFAKISKPMSHKDTSHESLVEHALRQAGPNRRQLELALQKVPADQHDALVFLITNMPASDLHTLTASYLLRHVALAYEAKMAAPWGGTIPHDIFFNDVVPYASLDEPRDNSRARLRKLSLPLIAGATTSGEAAQMLNAKLFPLVKVKYSTLRERPNQNPTETIKSGIATCSGLSILLVDACRSVGIPARVAGTPMWMNMRGNHTWVEVWDGKTWRFTGAAEPDSQGLDHGWFVGDASQARRDMPEHSIYASSFRRTETPFPLVWAPGSHAVPAENVTDRYASNAFGGPNNRTHLKIRVIDEKGKRIAARVAVQQVGSTTQYAGLSHDEQADTNNFLTFVVPRSLSVDSYRATVTTGAKTIHVSFTAGANSEELVQIRTDGKVNHEKSLRSLLEDRFGANAERSAKAAKQLAGMKADPASRAIAWSQYLQSPETAALRDNFGKKIVSTTERTSPYLWRTVGEKPATGWALVIAMHGGGGAPKEVNDGEYQYMFAHYYKDHPEAGGYIYLALRAPNDTWNGFYDDAICPLVERLIKQFVAFASVDPDRVYTLGASHGGYGAFVIGPKIPYRFAAVHAAASAPTDGETRGENLRNLPFTIMTGALDDGYGRIDRDHKFMAQVDDWRKEYGGYDISLTSPEGVGHLVPDHDILADMLKSTRNAWPKHVVWSQSDSVLRRFYWIESDSPNATGFVQADVEGNTVTVTAHNQDKIALWLDDSIVDTRKPVTVQVVGGKPQTFHLKPNLETYCQGLVMTADPKLTAPCQVEVKLN